MRTSRTGERASKVNTYHLFLLGTVCPLRVNSMKSLVLFLSVALWCNPYVCSFHKNPAFSFSPCKRWTKTKDLAQNKEKTFLIIRAQCQCLPKQWTPHSWKLQAGCSQGAGVLSPAHRKRTVWLWDPSESIMFSRWDDAQLNWLGYHATSYRSL